MASLNRRPHGVEDSLRAVQFALLKSGFQQLNFGITSLCDHGKLQSDWFVWDNLTHEVCVQQQLVGLFVGLSQCLLHAAAELLHLHAYAPARLA